MWLAYSKMERLLQLARKRMGSVRFLIGTILYLSVQGLFILLDYAMMVRLSQLAIMERELAMCRTGQTLLWFPLDTNILWD